MSEEVLIGKLGAINYITNVDLKGDCTNHPVPLIKAETVEPIMSFSSDKLPSGVFEAHGIVNSIDPETMELEVQFSKKQFEKFHRDSAKVCSEKFSWFLPSELKPSSYEQSRSTQLKCLSDAAYKNKNYTAAENLGSAMEISQTREKKREETYENTLEKYRESVKVFIDHDNQGQFWKIFSELRSMKPTGIDPFIPLLTVFSGFISPSDLHDLISEARSIDEYKTYGIVQTYLNLTLQFAASNSKIVRTVYNANSLAVIQNQWSDDGFFKWFLPTYLSAGSDFPDSICFDCSTIIQYMNEAFSFMSTGQYKNAISKLVDATPFYVGNTRLYQYLSLAWCLWGDSQKPLDMLIRAKMLPVWPQISPHLKKAIMNFISSTETQLTPPTKPPPTTSRIEQAIKDFRAMYFEDDSAKKWCQSCLTVLDRCKDALSLSENNQYHNINALREGLSFVYWILKDIVRKSWKIIDSNDAQSVLEKSVELVKITYCTYDNLVVDGIRDCHIDALVTSDRKKVFIQPAIIDFADIQAEAKLGDDLKLTRESVLSLSIGATKLLLQLIGECSAQATLSGVDLNNLKIAPDSAMLFKHWVWSVIRSTDTVSGINTVKCALESLDEKKNTIDDNLVSWGEYLFKSYNHSTAEGHGHITKVRNAIERRWNVQYPGARSFHLAHSGYSKLNERNIFNLNIISSCSLAIPGDDCSTKHIFKFAGNIFGWRLLETFEEWGERLCHFCPHLLPPLDFEILGGEILNLTYDRKQPLPKIECPFKSSINSIQFLRALLKIYQSIHAKISAKITLIGNDDVPDFSTTRGWNNELTEWVKSNPDSWKDMIKNNSISPEKIIIDKSEKFYSLVKAAIQEKYKLTEEAKSEYDLDVYLKTVPGSNKEDSIVFKTAQLLENCRLDRTQSHNVYVNSEDDARSVFRVLLEVLIEQSFVQILFEKPARWSVSNWRIIDVELQTKLLSDLDHFHGPESHLTGHGPVQNHFNAGVFVQGKKSANCHIYFET